MPSNDMEWSARLPDNLVNGAYWFNGEAAWRKTEALDVLSLLQKHGYIVLGIDIWLPTSDGPRIPSKFVYDWDLMTAQKMAGVAKSAKEFVEGFSWAADDLENVGCEPFFLITADKLDG